VAPNSEVRDEDTTTFREPDNIRVRVVDGDPAADELSVADVSVDIGSSAEVRGADGKALVRIRRESACLLRIEAVDVTLEQLGDIVRRVSYRAAGLASSNLRSVEFAVATGKSFSRTNVEVLVQVPALAVRGAAVTTVPVNRPFSPFANNFILSPCVKPPLSGSIRAKCSRPGIIALSVVESDFEFDGDGKTVLVEGAPCGSVQRTSDMRFSFVLNSVEAVYCVFSGIAIFALDQSAVNERVQVTLNLDSADFSEIVADMVFAGAEMAVEPPEQEQRLRSTLSSMEAWDFLLLTATHQEALVPRSSDA
jgi:hypothetical protein